MNSRFLPSGVLAAALLIVGSGCAFNPQTANLAPKVSVMGSSEGDGVSVAVRVVDERATKSLGRRGTAYGAAAEITAAQDVAAVVSDEVIAGLKKKGFAAGPDSATADSRLTVEVRLLEYSTSQGFWTGGVHIQSALKVIATKNGQTFEKMYRTSKEERVAVVPTADTNEKWINDALSEALTQLLGDSELSGFLAKRS